MRNIVVLHDQETVLPAHLPAPLNTDMDNPKSIQNIASLPEETARQTTDTPVRPLAVVERETIENAIEKCDGNVPRAAALLEVSPSTIYRKKQAWEKSP
jgi:two-component system repressor protein LuxO